jgi:hypothetical protein
MKGIPSILKLKKGSSGDTPIIQHPTYNLMYCQGLYMRRKL